MLIDDVKAWWDANPCNKRHGIASVGTLEYSMQVTEKKYCVEPHIVWFAEFPKWNGKRVLDAGCGIGTDSISFAVNLARVTALDVSEESLAIARARAKAMAVDGLINFRQANLENMSQLYGRKFDLIYSFGVIHHTPNPEAALVELRRLARSGTELRIMLYNKWSTKALWLMLTGGWPFRSARRCVERQSEASANCPVAYTYSKRQAVKLLRKAGWEPYSVKVDHIFLYAIAPYKRGEYKRKWRWRFVPRPLFGLLERMFGWHILIKAVPK